MRKYVPVQTIESDESFPYDMHNWDYPTDLLLSCLYTVWWTEIPEDSDQELALLMDYDGFVEWFNEHVDEWMEDGDDPKDWTAEEYLPYHIGRTLDVVKEVKA